jgi:hypothetical protein
MNRTTSLGKGEKYDFTREGRGKNGQFYETTTDFDPKKPNAPAFTFGISRVYYEKAYCETNKAVDKNIPGPGKYNYLKPFGSDTFKFTMSGRLEAKNISRTSKSPGPGEYPIVSINPTGKFPLSNMNNVKNICFGVGKEKRFNYSCNYLTFYFLVNKNPGPDKYSLKPLITGSGFNYVSKYKSSTAKSLYGKERDYSLKLQSTI